MQVVIFCGCCGQPAGSIPSDPDVRSCCASLAGSLKVFQFLARQCHCGLCSIGMEAAVSKRNRRCCLGITALNAPCRKFMVLWGKWHMFCCFLQIQFQRWSFIMKTLTSSMLLGALLAVAGAVHADATQTTRNPESGHPNAGEVTPGLGSPAAGTAGSTGGSRTPGTSASGASVKCPESAMRPGSNGNAQTGTARQLGPSLAKNSSPSVSTSCVDETTSSAASSTSSSSGGTAGGGQAASGAGNSGSAKAGDQNAKQNTRQNAKQ